MGRRTVAANSSQHQGAPIVAVRLKKAQFGAARKEAPGKKKASGENAQDQL